MSAKYTDDAREILSILLASCDRLKYEMTYTKEYEGKRKYVGTWEPENPTFFYLNRNMEWARDLLKNSAEPE